MCEYLLYFVVLCAVLNSVFSQLALDSQCEGSIVLSLPGVG